MTATLVTPWSRDTSYFDRMLRLAGARRESRICAAGRSNVELLVKLCREGYAQVECLRQATCACADESADILLIPGAGAAESLVSIMLRTASVLRDGGVIVLKLDGIEDDCAVQAALGTLGLDVASTVFDLSGMVIVAHTVRRAQICALAS